MTHAKFCKAPPEQLEVKPKTVRVVEPEVKDEIKNDMKHENENSSKRIIIPMYQEHKIATRTEERK